MLHNEGDRLAKVVVCPPGEAYFSAADLKAQNMNAVPDRARTREQFERLISVMENAGCNVIRLEELEGHPNSVFARDASLCTPMGYVRLRMGLASRRGEEKWLWEKLESLGEPCASCIEPPGTVEGGDVILAGDVAFVGRSGRTNDSGVDQIRSILEEMGYEVRVHDVPGRSLHLGGVMSVIGPDTVVCSESAFRDDFFKGFKVIEVPIEEPLSGNVISLGRNNLVANSAESRLGIALLRTAGFLVHALDLSEFRKGGGGPSCLILPVERIQD